MFIDQSVFPLVNIALLIIALGLLLPIAVLFIECSAAFLPNRSQTLNTGISRPKTAVLIPAHNEEDVIGATLKTLLPQLTEQDQLLVIADNCSDKTATVARELGAMVVERHNLEFRGKGYALDYGMGFIKADPPEVVVLVDADCIVHPGTVERITRLATAKQRPVQSTYLMTQPDNPALKDLLSMLAVKFKNTVRPSGLNRMGLPSLLTGSGMAFPWSVISKISLAGSKTTDDMQLAVDLSIAGYPPIYCQQAQVTGRLMKDSSATSQRSRWEHGHIEMLLVEFPRTLAAAIRQRSFDLLALALELSVPPLSLLVMAWIAGTGVALLATALGAAWVPALILLVEGLLMLISIVLGWVKFCRDDLPVLTFLAVPFYLLWKIPLYIAFFVQPQYRWLRTERDAVDAQ
ncbi:MAG: glycosyltransferase [Symploca sp. SIO1C4]|uniref:Glycosyltransferase n=1 Tax=Symploca sp. SIO1C4 TaxID=2607765 RepID=A0A6B3NA64_9CYAN|nr:glycosyltransferase [Symploca sp. SIO1C4]